MENDEIRYVGVNDHKLDLFEGQYVVPNGMSYNSYAILDEKIAVMDAVEHDFTGEWLDRIQSALQGKEPDYLIVQHMEPDHSSGIVDFTERYPASTVVSSARAFAMMKNFFGTDFSSRRLVVGEGDSLRLGTHTLTFFTAPMVHWPEVIVTYDDRGKALFSADAFGKFGALDVKEDWTDEARRYYIGIVGKYGAQVQTLLKKVSALDVARIFPLHGPVLKEDLGFYLEKYRIWSSYQKEEKGTVIAYTSVYGNTKQAVLKLEKALTEQGCPKVVLYDLARCDMDAAVADAFRFGKLVLATTTYNGDIFPFMKTFLDRLTARNFSNRTVALIENGSWAPVAAKRMKECLSACKNLEFAQNVVTLTSALNENSLSQLEDLARELCAQEDDSTEKCADEKQSAGKKRGFVCRVCGYVYEGETLPAGFVCPLCGRGAENFAPPEERN